MSQYHEHASTAIIFKCKLTCLDRRVDSCSHRCCDLQSCVPSWWIYQARSHSTQLDPLASFSNGTRRLDLVRAEALDGWLGELDYTDKGDCDQVQGSCPKAIHMHSAASEFGLIVEADQQNLSLATCRAIDDRAINLCPTNKAEQAAKPIAKFIAFPKFPKKLTCSCDKLM